MLLNS